MRKSKPEIMIALPNGHLQSETNKLFSEAGYGLDGYHEEARIYRPTIDGRPNLQIKILRPQEIPLAVEEATYHLGVTGWDWLEETGVLEKNHVKVTPLLDLEHGFASVVLAIPSKTKRRNKIKDANDFLRCFWKEKTGVRIATEYINLTQKYIVETDFYKKKSKNIKPELFILPWISKRSNSPIKIILSHGATEAKPPENADAIVDNTSTRQTLKANDLIVIDDVLKKSTAWLIVNKDCLAKKHKHIRPPIYRLVRALHGAVLARRFLHIFANLPEHGREKLKNSDIRKLAQQEVTVIESSHGARIDLLIERKDYDMTLDSLRKMAATDVVALKPQRVAWPSKVDEKYEKRAPYLELFKDLDCI